MNVHKDPMMILLQIFHSTFLNIGDKKNFIIKIMAG